MEELDHRARVGRMLCELATAPDRLLELRNRCVGSLIAGFCHVGGWFLPMYGAGWIERRNIAEYERAARLSVLCGLAHLADDLLDMAEAEWEHERYFRLKAASHRLSAVLRVWPAPPTKAAIRQTFDKFAAAQAHAASRDMMAVQIGTEVSGARRGIVRSEYATADRGGLARRAAR
jgi:hypothetical protein